MAAAQCHHGEDVEGGTTAEKCSTCKKIAIISARHDVVPGTCAAAMQPCSRYLHARGYLNSGGRLSSKWQAIRHLHNAWLSQSLEDFENAVRMCDLHCVKMADVEYLCSEVATAGAVPFMRALCCLFDNEEKKDRLCLDDCRRIAARSGHSELTVELLQASTRHRSNAFYTLHSAMGHPHVMHAVVDWMVQREYSSGAKLTIALHSAIQQNWAAVKALLRLDDDQYTTLHRDRQLLFRTACAKCYDDGIVAQFLQLRGAAAVDLQDAYKVSTLFPTPHSMMALLCAELHQVPPQVWQVRRMFHCVGGWSGAPLHRGEWRSCMQSTLLRCLGDGDTLAARVLEQRLHLLHPAIRREVCARCRWPKLKSLLLARHAHHLGQPQSKSEECSDAPCAPPHLPRRSPRLLSRARIGCTASGTH